MRPDLRVGRHDRAASARSPTPSVDEHVNRLAEQRRVAHALGRAQRAQSAPAGFATASSKRLVPGGRDLGQRFELVRAAEHEQPRL